MALASPRLYSDSTTSGTEFLRVSHLKTFMCCRPFVSVLSAYAPPVSALLLPIGNLLWSIGFQFLTALVHRGVPRDLLRLISLGTNEPESQTTAVVIRSPCRRRASHAQRSFFASLSPPATLHDHANQHADRLPQSLTAPRMFGREKLVCGRSRFQLADNSRHRRPIVVRLGFFHTSMLVCPIEEFQHLIKRLLRVIQDVRKRSPLPVLKKLFSCDARACHG